MWFCWIMVLRLKLILTALVFLNIRLAAPVGAPFEGLDRVKLPAFLVRGGTDKTLRAPYYAQRIHLPELHRFEVIEGLRHHAFLSPFPAHIIKEVGPPAQDPSGFDRAEFLAFLNTEFVGFSNKLLDWDQADKMCLGHPSAWCHFERSLSLSR